MEVLEKEKAQRRKQNKEEEGGGTLQPAWLWQLLLGDKEWIFQFLPSPTGEMMLCRHFEQVSNQDNLFF